MKVSYELCFQFSESKCYFLELSKKKKKMESQGGAPNKKVESPITANLESLIQKWSPQKVIFLESPITHWSPQKLKSGSPK